MSHNKTAILKLEAAPVACHRRMLNVLREVQISSKDHIEIFQMIRTEEAFCNSQTFGWIEDT
jgi:hypothetical protein